MVVNQTKSNALNYAGFGLNPTATASGQVTPVCFVKYDSFDAGNDIKTEDDEGHTGSNILLLSKDRTSAEGAPAIQDKIRFGEGIEDFTYMILGAKDAPVEAVTGATIAKKHVYYQDVTGATAFPLATIMQGANVDSLLPDAFCNCVGNKLEFTLDADKSPTYKFTGLSDFPIMNQAEPTLTFPSTEYKLAAGSGTLYMGPALTAEATLKSDTYKMDCYKTASLDLNNNFESSVCGGTPFGQPNKDQKTFESSGKFELNVNTNNVNLEALWATGATDGTNVTTDALYKSLLFSFVGSKKIETVGTVDVYPSMDIYLPKVDIKFTRSRDGDDAMKMSGEFDVVSPGASTAVKVTIVSALSAIHEGVAVP